LPVGRAAPRTFALGGKNPRAATDHNDDDDDDDDDDDYSRPNTHFVGEVCTLQVPPLLRPYLYTTLSSWMSLSANKSNTLLR